MNRRTALLACALVAVGGSSVPAMAAKAKPKPITGTYTLTTTPDPTYEVLAEAGKGAPGCDHALPAGGKDSHPFTVPAAGTLSVVLDGNDPSKGAAPASPDWDLYVMQGADVAGESTGGTAHEEIVLTFKGKTEVSFDACNNTGLPQATVSYTFTYT